MNWVLYKTTVTACCNRDVLSWNFMKDMQLEVCGSEMNQI